jgi:hypothetical protein
MTLLFLVLSVTLNTSEEEVDTPEKEERDNSPILPLGIVAMINIPIKGTNNSEISNIYEYMTI